MEVDRMEENHQWHKNVDKAWNQLQWSGFNLDTLPDFGRIVKGCKSNNIKQGRVEGIKKPKLKSTEWQQKYFQVENTLLSLQPASERRRAYELYGHEICRSEFHVFVLSSYGLHFSIKSGLNSLSKQESPILYEKMRFIPSYCTHVNGVQYFHRVKFWH